MSATDSTAVKMPHEGVHVDLSPDGRWLAYVRTRDQAVVVSPVPPTGLEYQVSRGGR